MKSRSHRCSLLVAAWSCWCLAVALPWLVTEAGAQTVGTFTSLHSFTGTDGGNPRAPLIQGDNGNFFGTTALGGTNETGTIYELDVSNAVGVLYSFGAVSKDKATGGGIYPEGGLIEVNSVFYGSTYAGGDNGTGTLFQQSFGPTVAFSTLYTFDSDTAGSNADGSDPSGSLIVGLDGAFYGTASQGGTYNGGTVFQATSAGGFVALYDFGKPGANEGITPYGGVIQTSDGFFYGTTQDGGLNSAGTVFQLTPQGVLHTLHNFGSVDGNEHNADGGGPATKLTVGSDGALYGVTGFAGSEGGGTVFKITTNGDFTLLYSFSNVGSDGTNSDGADPSGGLVLGADGNFYGTTALGGKGVGTIFQITPAGVLTTLYMFSATDSSGINIDGAHPDAELTAASDGSFYGVTYDGGTSARGTLYAISLLPTITSAATANGNRGHAVLLPVHRDELPDELPAGCRHRRQPAAGAEPELLHGGHLGHAHPERNVLRGTTAFNAFGFGTFASGSETFTVKIADAPTDVPVITSAAGASAEAGVAFTYQIVATNFPTSYGADGLPTGLTVNPKTGLISGKPTTVGTSMVTLSATNIVGTGSTVLTLVTAANPDIPTVTIVVRGTGEAVKGEVAGKVVVKRVGGDTSADLTVSYKARGSAKADVDYQELAGTVTIPAGAAQAKVKVKPIEGMMDGVRVVKIKLLADPTGGYVLGSPAKAKIKVADDDDDD